MNSRSCLLYAVTGPSVICNVLEPVEIFGNVSMQFGTLAITSMGNFTEIVTGECLCRGGVLVQGVAKYSNFGSIEGYILKMVQDRR